MRRKRSPKQQRTDHLDSLWRRLIHSRGPCVFIGENVGGKPHVCKGPIQAMHGIPRGRYRTRWHPDNGWPGCASGHYFYTLNKEEWTYWLLKRWGYEKFVAMWALANSKDPIDYEAVERGMLGG